MTGPDQVTGTRSGTPTRSLMLKLMRFVVSIGLIALLIIRLDLAEVVDHLRGLLLLPVLAGAAMQFGMIFSNALRWKLVLRAKDMHLSVGRVVYYYLMAIFFSAFLPTSIGGDVARIVAASGETGRPADTFASVLIDRLLGFLALLPVGLIALPFVAGQLADWKLTATVGVIALSVFGAMYLVLLKPVAKRLSGLLTPLFNMLGRFKVREKLEQAYDAVVGYRDCKGTILLGLAISVISRLCWVFGCHMIGRALGLNLSIAALLLVVPVVELVRMLPISIAGIGVREAAFVTMLGQFGVNQSMAFAFSIVVYIVFFGFSILGGILYGTRQFVSRS